MNDDPERELSTIPKLWAAFITMVRAKWPVFVSFARAKFRDAPPPIQLAVGTVATIAAGVMLWFVGWLMFPSSQKRNAGNESATTVATANLAAEEGRPSGTGVKLSVLVNALNVTPPELDESRSHDFVYCRRFEEARPQVLYMDTQNPLMLDVFGDAENVDEIRLMMQVENFGNKGADGAAAFDRCVQRITAAVDPNWVDEITDSLNRNVFRLFKGPGIVMESHRRGQTARVTTIDWQNSMWVVFSIGTPGSSDRNQKAAATKSNDSTSAKTDLVPGVRLAFLMWCLNLPDSELPTKFHHRFVLRHRQNADETRVYKDLRSVLVLTTSGQTDDLKEIHLAMRWDEFLNEDSNGAGAFGRCVQHMTEAVDPSWVAEVYDALNQNIPRLGLDQGNPIVRQRRGLTASFVVKDDLIQFTIDISGRDIHQAR